MPASFQFEAVRDLVGILRAMYAEEKMRSSPSSTRMKRIESVARELVSALESAEQHDPGTAPYERARSRAEGAVLRIGDLVDVISPLEPVLHVAGKRVLGTQPVTLERDAKRAAGKLRN